MGQGLCSVEECVGRCNCGCACAGGGGRVQGCSGLCGGPLAVGGCLYTDIGNNNQKVLFGSC